ncbi:hypothetical protein [Nitrobacter sp. TKz-YC02]
MAGAGLIEALGMRLHSQIIERIFEFLVLLRVVHTANHIRLVVD